MSALRSPRTTAWQAERQPHGSFGHTRCAFHPSAMSTDISVPLGTTLHFHSMPQYANFAPKVIDFKRINWYMWSTWKRGHEISLEMKRRQAMRRMRHRYQANMSMTLNRSMARATKGTNPQARLKITKEQEAKQCP